jgi:lincosamide nucleotidyltransferase A/C/D/E
MDAGDVCAVLDVLDRAGIAVWVDGGWGVDALAGEQTRTHADLDVALSVDDLAGAEAALVSVGFERDETAVPALPARLPLVHEPRWYVDLHPLLFDDGGNGWQQLSETGRSWGVYPADELEATGTIAGRRVRCLAATLQFRFRLGYEWSDRDEHDIRLLSERFGLPRPPTLPEAR